MATTYTRGWPLVGWAALGVGALVAGVLAWRGFTPAGYSGVLIVTAVTSTMLFLAAFTASSFHELLPGPRTRWLVANRRYLGVSFAVSHTYHLAAILAVVGSGSREVDATTVVAGGLAYVFLFAMVATSFDRTAAALGPVWWKRLHKTGLYYLWFVLIFTYASGSPLGLRQLLLGGLLLAGWAVRLAAWAKRQRD